MQTIAGTLIILRWGQLRNSRSRKGSLPSSFLPKRRASFSCTRKRKIFSSPETELTPRWIWTNKPTKLTLSFHQLPPCISGSLSQFITLSLDPFFLCFATSPIPTPLTYHSLLKCYVSSQACFFRSSFLTCEGLPVHTKLLTWDKLFMRFSCKFVFCQFNS